MSKLHTPYFTDKKINKQNRQSTQQNKSRQTNINIYIQRIIITAKISKTTDNKKTPNKVTTDTSKNENLIHEPPRNFTI